MILEYLLHELPGKNSGSRYPLDSSLEYSVNIASMAIGINKIEVSIQTESQFVRLGNLYRDIGRNRNYFT